VAGNGTFGFTTDNIKATSAILFQPIGVAVDTLGNIYIADYRNDRIRKVTRSTGLINTVAGDGSYDFGGDGGPATAATLSRPSAVAVDASGNIYISDSYNNRVRLVTKSTGVINTVAGIGSQGYSGDSGLAKSAELSDPAGVAVDASGNIYIADNSNHRVRMVTKSSLVITTVAGNGTSGYSGDGIQAISANLYNPSGVAVDASGNIYIADSYNNRIRLVTKNTGIITTVAGTGRGSYSGDSGQATSANLWTPVAIALDALGNIYIADCYNNLIRLVSKSTGIIITLAGNGRRGYGGDNGQATSATLQCPQGVAVDALGRVYIADQSDRIRMVEATELPTSAPSAAPTSTKAPSVVPTRAPSVVPTRAPSAAPTSTRAPSVAPTSTRAPSVAPTSAPSTAPTSSSAPTTAPTSASAPSTAPTSASAPTTAPTSALAPSTAPTSALASSTIPTPTLSPSAAPTSTPSPLPIPATSLIATSSTTSSTAFSTNVLPGVIGGVGGFLLILFILAVICCCRRR
jgi:trimeric autotransporter adhesin